MRYASQTVKKASQSSPHMRRIESQSFLTAACTWTKIRIRLQVWNLFTAGKQIMRAADCNKLAEKPEGVFRQDGRACRNAVRPVLLEYQPPKKRR